MADQEQREESRSQNDSYLAKKHAGPNDPPAGAGAEKDETQPAEEWGQRQQTGEAIHKGGKD